MGRVFVEQLYKERFFNLEQDEKLALLSEELFQIVPIKNFTEGRVFKDFIYDYFLIVDEFYNSKKKEENDIRINFPTMKDKISGKIIIVNDLIDVIRKDFINDIQTKSKSSRPPVELTVFLSSLEVLSEYYVEASEKYSRREGRPSKEKRANMCLLLIQLFDDYTIGLKISKSNNKTPFRAYIDLALNLTYGYNHNRDIYRITRDLISFHRNQ